MSQTTEERNGLSQEKSLSELVHELRKPFSVAYIFLDLIESKDTDELHALSDNVITEFKTNLDRANKILNNIGRLKMSVQG